MSSWSVIGTLSGGRYQDREAVVSICFAVDVVLAVVHRNRLNRDLYILEISREREFVSVLIIESIGIQVLG
jgi:hypothetical protein